MWCLFVFLGLCVERVAAAAAATSDRAEGKPVRCHCCCTDAAASRAVVVVAVLVITGRYRAELAACVVIAKAELPSPSTPPPLRSLPLTLARVSLSEVLSHNIPHNLLTCYAYKSLECGFMT